MRIYLVRHGRTQWNKEQRIQGSMDPPLDEEGHAQAERLGQRLQEVDFEMIYSSPMQRAQQTAMILNRSLNKQIALVPDLREACYGTAEGLTWAEYYDIYADAIAERLELTPAQKFQHRVVPDGESPAEICGRCHPFLDTLRHRWMGKNLLVVSHGEVIRTALVSLFELDYEQLSIENTGYVVLEYQDSMFTLKESHGLSGSHYDLTHSN